MFGKWATVPDEKIKDFTWKTSVDIGFRYLLRLHFCERGLQLAETRNRVFCVSINDMIAETNVDIGKERSFRIGVIEVEQPREQSCKSKPLPSQTIFKIRYVLNLLSFFVHGNAIATGAVIIISLVNIITYKLQKIWEDNCTDSGYKPSRLTEKLCRPFSLTEIQSATENFNDALVIGRGGFGKVYRGFISKEQKIVAIKRLKSNSKKGAREFWTEWESDYHSSLSWEQRLRICTGVGRGLDYLHTGTDQGIIHRDIKASNIPLDKNLEAKISDFGLAKA
ncbi:receptor kinase At5g39000 [Olea europaea subsp. europaea]|uniref:non-specific serine/threonine protein kinase n=1 Tax=Olea europaea subsp. europaea TaxID=158383 RepID=A0A8S0T3S6_OLEEU|nr:receptor kinase At5g39000 [Olea europaea subsp. europaea]